MAQPPQPSPTLPAPALRVRAGRSENIGETLAVEAPLEIRLNGRSHAIVMVNPSHLEALALGFCLSEGLVSSPAEVLGIKMGEAEVPGLGRAWWADVALPPELARRARVSRVAPAATSCGLCGLESLKDIRADIAPLAVEGPLTDLKALFKLFALMEEAQVVFGATGATHAAALGTPAGQLVSVAEDVDRHNALDKAIGLALQADQDLRRCLAVLSGRLSFEMALKAARVGLAVVGSVSAPTSLSLMLMDKLGLTLVAFARPPRATVYTHPQRVAVRGRPLAWEG